MMVTSDVTTNTHTNTTTEQHSEDKKKKKQKNTFSQEYDSKLLVFATTPFVVVVRFFGVRECFF